MSIIELLKIEFMKVKRSMILPLLLIPPILVVISGVSSISMYMTPEYTDAWSAMFIQSALLFGYYLLPFSMVIVCVMISNRETKNNGILKMLALPVSKGKLALAKFFVLLSFLMIELLIFFSSFIIAGIIATKIMNVAENIPVFYLLTWTLKLFATMIPAIACMWAITVLFEKPLLSMGLNLLLIIPGVLIANTPLWLVYPYCYSGYVVSDALHTVTTTGTGSTISLFPFVPCAVIISVFALFFSIKCFGRKEMRYKMKKIKLSVVSLVISLLPFITLLFSLFTEKITGGLQTGLIVLNIISILSGFGLSISLVKKPKRRDVFSIVALCICTFFGLLMLGILTFGLIATFM